MLRRQKWRLEAWGERTGASGARHTIQPAEAGVVQLSWGKAIDIRAPVRRHIVDGQRFLELGGNGFFEDLNRFHVLSVGMNVAMNGNDVSSKKERQDARPKR